MITAVTSAPASEDILFNKQMYTFCMATMNGWYVKRPNGHEVQCGNIRCGDTTADAHSLCEHYAFHCTDNAEKMALWKYSTNPKWFDEFDKFCFNRPKLPDNCWKISYLKKHYKDVKLC